MLYYWKQALTKIRYIAINIGKFVTKTLVTLFSLSISQEKQTQTQNQTETDISIDKSGNPNSETASHAVIKAALGRRHTPTNNVRASQYLKTHQ